MMCLDKELLIEQKSANFCLWFMYVFEGIFSLNLTFTQLSRSCDLFTTRELQLFSYYVDMKTYWTKGGETVEYNLQYIIIHCTNSYIIIGYMFYSCIARLYLY